MPSDLKPPLPNIPRLRHLLPNLPWHQWGKSVEVAAKIRVKKAKVYLRGLRAGKPSSNPCCMDTTMLLCRYCSDRGTCLKCTMKTIVITSTLSFKQRAQTRSATPWNRALIISDGIEGEIKKIIRCHQ